MQSVDGALEFLPGRLYHVVASAVPPDTADECFFSIDDELVYERFFADFGPLNLGMMYRYCAKLRAKLESEPAERRICHVCSGHEHHRSNSAVLIGSYMIIFEGKTAEDAFRPFLDGEPLIPFRDAAFTICTYSLTVLDTLRGVSKAVQSGFLKDFASFPIDEYERDEKIENGDSEKNILYKCL